MNVPFLHRLIHERHAAGDIPSIVGVEGTGVIAAICLVIVIVGSPSRRTARPPEEIDRIAAERIFSAPVIRRTLRIQDFFLLIAPFFAVLRIKVSICADAGHVVYRDRCRCFNTGIESKVRR